MRGVVVSVILIGGKGSVVGTDDDDGDCRASSAAGVDATVAELAGITREGRAKVRV